jgi:Ca-activated chloride channel homolog
MKHRSQLFLFAIVLLFTGLLPVSAQGIIMPPPGVFTDPSWLKIDYHYVNVTIENQIATTRIDMQFTNEGDALAEGTFIFPLPEGAAVDRLTMHVDGIAIEARILAADEARRIYDNIVRQYRDPALLEYIGTSAIQASVFPIPPGDSRRIELAYGQVLEADNGLINYVYPMNSAALTRRPIGQMSINVQVTSSDRISNIYSPSHRIAVHRSDDDRGFNASYEGSRVFPDGDFSMFYGLENNSISVNLLSYRESMNEDGFFLLMVQPPVRTQRDRAIARDIIIVLDQSGSMIGEKWDQARDAAAFVLERLNPRDRFNIISFSTGMRLYSDDLEPVSEVDNAIAWMNRLNAEGGTDINLALTAALEMADPQRNTTVLFLTDGLPTVGVVYREDILANIKAIPTNARIFTFGVGYDVDTFLLDEIASAFRGTGTYVRPDEHIEDKVAGLYSKISAPVLTDTRLDFDGARVELMYPAQLPDLFAGEQLTLVGRYRDGVDDLTLRLSGVVEGQEQVFIYDGLNLRQRAGGEAFIARLWATRRIGDLLNTIRLRGENPELVDSVINLSLRYGIITPYTSFLIEEDDILTQQGRQRAADDFRRGEAAELSRDFTGAGAVEAASDLAGITAAEAPAPAMMPFATQTAFDMDGEAEPSEPGAPTRAASNPISSVGDKTFIRLNDVWNDTAYDPDTMETIKVVFLSDEYFALLDEHPELGPYFALGDRVIVVLDGTAYEVTAE